MEKIPTIFDRDWDGNRGVVANLVANPGKSVAATEKLDGTNVRVTVRAGVMVRVEARRNPSSYLKKCGVTEPWYRDAWQVGTTAFDPGDQHLVRAAENVDCSGFPDGEWSGEAIGPKIQGNPLKLEDHRVLFFDWQRLPDGVCVPRLGLRSEGDEDGLPEPLGPEATGEHPLIRAYFHELHGFLLNSRSRVNPDVGMEGIVWHAGDGEYGGKIKLKDFK